MGTKPDFGAWEELLITAGACQCVPLGALPTQAVEDSVAVQLQEDGNGFLIAGAPLIHLHVLSLFCHLSNSDSRRPGFGVVQASGLMIQVNDRSPFSSK